MRPNQIKNVSYLTTRRKTLRNNLTPAEALLWEVLKNSNFRNKKFRRQHSIENYIVDFYCPSEKLIIELDGQGHFEAGQMEYDGVRDNRLKELGNTIVRFENNLVFKDIDGVLRVIESNFKTN